MGFELLSKILEKHFGKRGTKIVICLALMIFGIKSSEIKQRYGVSYNALRRYKTALQAGNIDQLFINNGYRKKSELEKYDDILMEEFDKHPPQTLRDAQERIKSITGLTRSLHRILVYLQKKGLKSRAVGFMPSKANPEVQKSFLDDTLLPLIDKAKAGIIELFFMDASHFVMGGFPGRVWSIVRKWVKTSSGRQRFNVLGALNFATKKVEMIVNDTYITSCEVVMMLEKLTLAHAGKSINDMIS